MKERNPDGLTTYLRLTAPHGSLLPEAVDELPTSIT